MLGASVMFSVPWLRELLMWAGARDVSKSSIRHALTVSKRSIMLVPGGQSEMRLCSGDISVQRFHKRHRGFVRQALLHGVDLVPVLSLNENELLHNINWPKTQAFTTKWIGFGLPLWVHGRWFSPLPHATPVTVVVGEPISVKGKGGTEPSEELVGELHAQYFDALEALFDKHKAAAGLAHSRLEYVS